MGMPIVFFDVETPNRHNDRLCSIALVATDESGKVLGKWSTLVNPETRFEDINMGIHGICQRDVEDAPTFPEVWESLLRPVFVGSRVVAHNARFDLSVVSKCLESYGCGTIGADYACTMTMAKKSNEIELPNYKLPTLCDCLGVRLERHHDATSDAEACMALFWKLADKGRLDSYFEPYFRYGGYGFEISFGRERRRGRGYQYSDRTKAMQGLIKALEGVLVDGDVSTDEAQGVLDLIDANESLHDDPIVREIDEKVHMALVDGDVSPSEARDLAELFGRIVSPVDSSCPCGIQFKDRKFALTGAFTRGTKASIEEKIRERGGTILKSVTKKCDYLVVGGVGSEAWSFGSYGNKVKKALEMQQSGLSIEIVGEDKLFECFE